MDSGCGFLGSDTGSGDLVGAEELDAVRLNVSGGP
jgi:hypothetical protein